MQDRIQFKQDGKYISLPELLRQHGRLLLEYKSAADQIQVKRVYETAENIIVVLGSIGALKHNFGGDV